MESYKVNTEPVITVIDGAHMIRRAIYQPNLRSLTNSQGIPSGGVYGFTQSLKAVCNQMAASATVVVWEGGHSERRKEIYPTYKDRGDTGEEPEKDENGYTDFEFYLHQVSWTQKLLESFGVPQVMVKGKEGDDSLFQVVHLLRGHKIIVSEDRDFFTLISPKISVYRPIKKEFVDLNNFESITDCPTPKHYLYLKAIVGDGSDNIPAVAKGVGGTTALNVLKRIENPDDLSPSRVLQEAATFSHSRYLKLVAAGEAPLTRNLDLIDISREKFNVFELQEIVDVLNNQRYPNLAMANKIMGALEFNPDTMKYLTNRLTAMSSFPLANLVDKSYIKQVMMGQSITVQG